MNKNTIIEFLNIITSAPLLMPVIFIAVEAIAVNRLFNEYGITSLLIFAAVWLIVSAVPVVLSIWLRTREHTRIICTTAFILGTIFLGIYVGNCIKSAKCSDYVNLSDYETSIRITKINRKFDGSITYYAQSDDYGKIVVYDNEIFGAYDVGVGDKFFAEGILSVPEVNSNPGEFNYRDYLYRQGIYHVFSITSVREYERRSGIIMCSADIISDALFSFRQKLYFELCSVLEKENAPLAAAVFLGDKSEIDDSTYRAFRLTNSSHLLACSGTHFTSFLLLLSLFLDRFCKKGRTKTVLMSVFSVIVGMITGFGNSVSRAFFMCIGRYLNSDGVSGLCFASMIMILAKPYSVMEQGFQMSFAISLFIIIYMRKIEDAFELPQYLSLTIIALLAMLPFMITTDYYLSLPILLAQLANNTILTAVCVIFVPCLILSQVFLPFIWPVDMLLALMRKIAELSSGIALYSINIGDIYYPLLMAFWLFIIILLMPKCLIKPYLKIAVVALLAVCVGFSFAEYILLPNSKMVFADVGQGDSILIITDKYTALIDGGTYDKGERTLVSLLDYYGINKVDYGILTHLDSDHGGGIAALYNKNRIKTLYSSFAEEGQLKELGFESIPQLTILTAGDKIILSDTTILDIISPEYALDGDNDSSLVIEVISNSTTVLLTGDISSEKEEYLVENNMLDNVDVLKVAHHGSRFSTSEIFLDTVCPEFAVVSAGKYNSYGHPSKNVIDRLHSNNSDVYTTIESGAVFVDIYSDRYHVYGYKS
ncbi:MAG: DNA internalization-related competence protein ComEC/Rec2 [Clostridia bacterium]|nr:DNA internalization-related competence protein ComEC/Rec2 [Clostridia bacterium]